VNARRAAVAAGAVLIGIGAGLWSLAPRRPVPRGPAQGSGEPAEESDALSAAWKAVVAHPREADAWLALGDLQSAREQVDAAEHSYRTAVSVSGGGGALAYARLGFLLYGRGDDERALALLVEAKRRGALDPMLDFTIRAIKERADGGRDAAFGAEKLRESAEARPAGEDATPDAGLASPPPRGSDAIDAGDLEAGVARSEENPPIAARTTPVGTKRRRRLVGMPESASECTIAVTRSHERGGFLIEADLDGAPARLLIDTGATISVISREMLAQIGRVPEDRQIRVLTANGPVNMALARIQAFSVGGRVAEMALVGVCDDCVRGIADGLLGLDLQAALGLELELGSSRVRFADCDR
jgi:predicted aspartyl protease